MECFISVVGEWLTHCDMRTVALILGWTWHEMHSIKTKITCV